MTNIIVNMADVAGMTLPGDAVSVYTPDVRPSSKTAGRVIHGRGHHLELVAGQGTIIGVDPGPLVVHLLPAGHQRAAGEFHVLLPDRTSITLKELLELNYTFTPPVPGGSGGGGSTGSGGGYVTPQDYGARADGITDDTVAIQAALDTIPANGGVIQFPPGTYLVSGQSLRYGSTDTYGALYPKPYTTMMGLGKGSVIKLVDGTTKVDMIYARDTPGLKFENITIDAGPRLLPYWTTCMQLNTCDQLVMNNVTALNGNIEGIYIFNSTNFVLDGIHAHHNGAYQEDASGLHLDSCRNGVIDNVNAHDNGFHGVIFSSSWEILASNIQAHHNGWQGLHVQTGSNKITVSNAMLTHNARGLYIRDWGSDNNIFNNLTVAHNTFNGVMTYVTYGNVINGLMALGNGEYGVETYVDNDELFVWAGQFKDNGLAPYHAVVDSILWVNGTQVIGE